MARIEKESSPLKCVEPLKLHDEEWLNMTPQPPNKIDKGNRANQNDQRQHKIPET